MLKVDHERNGKVAEPAARETALESAPVAAAAPLPDGAIEMMREEGLVIWRGRKVIDGRAWATSVSLAKEMSSDDAGKALTREFKRGHCWLVNGVEDVKPLPEKVKLLVNVFTYSKQIGADVFSWCCGVGPTLDNHPRVSDVRISYTYGYPTDKVRNAVVKEAREHGHDYVLMLDDDQVPDIGLRECPERTDMVPFLTSAVDFALAHDGPCLVGAPYCSGPPLQQVLVMKNREYVPDLLDGMGLKIDKYTRDEASRERGIKQVMGLPTGCLLVDLRVLDVLPPPWFSYEFDDPPFNTSLASTEDIVFTRNLDWLGVKQYCHWSAWAGHAKSYTTGVPTEAPVVDIPRSIYRRWASGWRPNYQRA